jgi:hypothetical protein
MNVFEIALLRTLSSSLLTIIRRSLAIIPSSPLVICLFRRLIDEDKVRTSPDAEDFMNDTPTYVFA